MEKEISEMSLGTKLRNYAIRGDEVELLKALKNAPESDRKKALAEKNESEGKTPLHYACLRREYGCINILLEFDADASIADNLGNTSLHYFKYVNESGPDKNYKFQNRLNEALIAEVKNGTLKREKLEEKFTSIYHEKYEPIFLKVRNSVDKHIQQKLATSEFKPGFTIHQIMPDGNVQEIDALTYFNSQEAQTNKGPSPKNK